MNLGRIEDTTSFAAAVADAAPAIAPSKVMSVPQARMLDDDEIVQVSIKPSLWYIAALSSRWSAVMLLLAGALWLAAAQGASQLASVGIVLALLAAGGRVAIGVLQWASQVYVLTNRRVLRFGGIQTVVVAECPLARIGQIDLHIDWQQRLLRLGTISMRAANENSGAVVWEYVARPADVYQILVRAVRRAQNTD